MEKSDVVEEFYGVYLLKCLNPKYKGQTYIGYTVDPNRRIKQHNKGSLYGGARRTSKRGPWEMTLTVHGFPSDIAALRFEWAWQHPTRSRRLKSLIKKKKSSETSFQYCLKVMFTMLRVPPWCRLPLTLRWLSADVMVDPPPNLAPPMHMPIVYGPVVSKKLNSPKKKTKTVENPQDKDDEEEFSICKLCHEITNKNQSLTCLKNECQAKWHVVCLAKYFLERESTLVGNRGQAKNQILPLEGSCSECDSVMLWGDLVRKKNGCYSREGRTEHSSSDNTISSSPFGG